VLIPKRVLELHRGDLKWLCSSIEKGLYSVDVDRLLELIKSNCCAVEPEDSLFELDLSVCPFSFYLAGKEKLRRIKEEYKLNDGEVGKMIFYLALYGFLMGEV